MKKTIFALVLTGISLSAFASNQPVTVAPLISDFTSGTSSCNQMANNFAASLMNEFANLFSSNPALAGSYGTLGNFFRGLQYNNGGASLNCTNGQCTAVYPLSCQVMNSNLDNKVGLSMKMYISGMLSHYNNMIPNQNYNNVPYAATCTYTQGQPATTWNCQFVS